MFQLQTITSIAGPNNCDSIKAAICFQTLSVWSLRFLPGCNAIHWHRVLTNGERGVQELEEKYCSGNSTDVAITEVDEHNRRFLCSQALAAEHKGLRALRCGYQVTVVSMLVPGDPLTILLSLLTGCMDGRQEPGGAGMMDKYGHHVALVVARQGWRSCVGHCPAHVRVWRFRGPRWYTYQRATAHLKHLPRSRSTL